MKWFLFSMLVMASAQDFPNMPEDTAIQAMDEDVEECQKGVKDLRNDMMGLELFLQDKKDYAEHCPSTAWEQPPLDEYKVDPKSYLPEGCKPAEEEE